MVSKFQRQSSASRSRSSRTNPTTASTARRGQRTATGSIGGKGTGPKPPLQLLDAEGRDVTPRSLLDPNKRVTADDVGRKPSEAFALGDRSVIWGGNRDYRTTVGVDGGGTAFPTNFNRSTRGSNYSVASAHLSTADDFGDDLAPSGIVAGLADVQTLRRGAEKEQLQDADLNKLVTLTLSESDTFSLLELPSTWAPADTDEAALVIAENARRDELAGRLRESREGLVDHASQTIANAGKNKEVQVAGPAAAEAGAQASAFDIADTFSALSLQMNAQRVGGKSALAYARRAINAFKGIPPTPYPYSSGTQTELYVDPLAVGSTEPTLRDLGFGLKRVLASSDAPADPVDLKSLAQLGSFQASCRLTERLVAHTLRRVPQQQYRREPSALAAIDATSEPCVRGLWTYSCRFTDGRAVTAMAWNKHNPDILAVGYGSLEFGGAGTGLVCCWSIKNPEYPERLYHTTAPVTALDFALERPSFLAVGLQDGNLAVFDVIAATDTAQFDTRDRDIANKHSQPVWDLKWVVRERMIGEERGEILVSAGADGRVLQWSLLRGLEHTEIMLAKRVAKDTSTTSGEVLHKGNAKAAFMARTATLMGIDFLPDDHNIYLLVTEDGNIHRCSCSYNEQFLSSYTGHSGAIYRVCCNPNEPQVFLTCGADWSVKLWLRDSEQPRASLQASVAPVLNATWSPHCPSVLASLSGGTLSVWDLAVRPMDPVISVPVSEDSTLTSVLFASNADAILTGDSAGRVYVQLLCNMPDHSAEPIADQRARLLAELNKSK